MGVVHNLAHFGKRVDEFRARTRAMRVDTRDVAPADAESCEQEVVTCASGDATEFHLAPDRHAVRVDLDGCHRQPDISLDAFTNQTGCAFHLFTLYAAGFLRQLIDPVNRREQLAPGPFDLFSYRRINRPLMSTRRLISTTLPRKENCARRERPQEHRACCLQQRERTASARLPAQQRGDAEGGSGSQVDGDGFAQSHGNK